MEDKNINIFVLTHKRFDYPTNEVNDIYMPLLCNSTNINEDLNYLKDNVGDNISHLNKYYSELSGEYWAWKNTDADIIGFCHYRRYFAKNFLLNKLLNEEDIKNDLKDFDIILPQISYIKKTPKDLFFRYMKNHPYGAKPEEYDKLKKIIKKNYPNYLSSFDKIMNGKKIYFKNMFITRKDIANDYFQWLFTIFKELEEKINFSEYLYGNLRVFGYVSEALLNIYVDNNNLKIKERYLIETNSLSPHMNLLGNRFPLIYSCLSPISKIINNIKND